MDLELYAQRKNFFFKKMEQVRKEYNKDKKKYIEQNAEFKERDIIDVHRLNIDGSVTVHKCIVLEVYINHYNMIDYRIDFINAHDNNLYLDEYVVKIIKRNNK